MPHLILLGVGAAGCVEYAPAGLLLEYGHVRVGFDGGPGSEPPESIHAWLVSDLHDELQPARRKIARETDMPDPAVVPFDHLPLRIEPMPVARLAYGYRLSVGHRIGVWTPVLGGFPAWAEGADLMFADATESEVRIGDLAAEAKHLSVRRLVFVRLGTAAMSALDAGGGPPHGEWGQESRTYRL